MNQGSKRWTVTIGIDFASSRPQWTALAVGGLAGTGPLMRRVIAEHQAALNRKIEEELMSDDKERTENQDWYDILVHEKYKAESPRDRTWGVTIPQYQAQYQQQPVPRLGGIPARRAEQGSFDRIQQLESLLASYSDKYDMMAAESHKTKIALGEVERKLIVAEEAKQIVAKNSVAREAHIQIQLDELQKRFDEKELVYCQMIKTRDDQIFRQHRELLNSSVTASIPDKPTNKGGRPIIHCQSTWDIDS